MEELIDLQMRETTQLGDVNLMVYLVEWCNLLGVELQIEKLYFLKQHVRDKRASYIDKMGKSHELSFSYAFTARRQIRW